MNTGKMQIGNKHEKLIRIFFWLVIISVTVYLMSSILYYMVIEPNVRHWVMRNPEKPFFAFLVKWIYALVILFSVKNISQNPYRYYKWLNTVSFGVLFLWIMLRSILYRYYECNLELSILEIIALVIIIFTNSKIFIQKYHIRRSVFLYFFIFMIVKPLIWTACVYFVLNYCYTLSDNNYNTWIFHFPYFANDVPYKPLL